MKLEISNDTNLLSKELLTQLHQIINTCYWESEKEFWPETYERINLKGLETIARKKKLFCAIQEKSTPIGCISVTDRSSFTASFAMLTVDFNYRRQGIAKKLVDVAESWAREQGKVYMELELLIPKEFNHPDKDMLNSWYQKIGYLPVKTSDFSKTHPELDPLLKIPCNFVLYRKQL